MPGPVETGATGAFEPVECAAVAGLALEVDAGALVADAGALVAGAADGRPAGEKRPGGITVGTSPIATGSL